MWWFHVLYIYIVKGFPRVKISTATFFSFSLLRILKFSFLCKSRLYKTVLSITIVTEPCMRSSGLIRLVTELVRPFTDFPCILHLCPQQALLYNVSLSLTVYIPHVNDTAHHSSIFVWLMFSLSIMPSRFIQSIANDRISFILKVEYLLVDIYLPPSLPISLPVSHIFFIHLPVKRHLFPCPAYCESCCCEHGNMYIPSR